MGCCCCCVSGRKVRRDQPQQDLESGGSIGPPPPYDAKDHDEPENSMITPLEKPLQELSIHLDSTTLYGNHKGQGVRVGVRSNDHSLYQAAAGGHLQEVKRLLESGFNPSDRTVCDWCPLHWAAHNDLVDGHEIVKLLVAYGADVNQVSDTGLTPLDLARRAKRTENVRFLEGIGAKTGVQTQRTKM
ncbi:ankyrin [Acephala macrosclerotiorum]|nr:ankyrin [Acephala macrosclerotiorum]